MTACSICHEHERTSNGYCKRCNAARRRRYYNTPGDARSTSGVVSAKLKSMGWLGKGIVYIRQIEREGQEPLYYIGKTAVPLERYGVEGTDQFIYLENISSEDERIQREKELICEFLQAGLPVANKMLKYC